MAIIEKLTAIADAIRTQSGKTAKLTLAQMPGEILDLQMLNFTVTGNPRPANPAANTIWVDTDTAITGWAFSPDQPENPANGSLWFKTGLASPVAFNALKKNSITMNPLNVQQYVDGSWVDKTAKSYQGGAWEAWWDGYLYKDGDEYEHITGGWVTAQSSFVENVTAVDPSITKKEGTVIIDIAQGGPNGGVYRTQKKVSFAGKTKLVFTGTAEGDNTDRCAMMIWSEANRDFTVGRVAAYQFGANFAGDAEIDVSALNGEYYVGFHVYGYGNPMVVMHQLKLS